MYSLQFVVHFCSARVIDRDIPVINAISLEASPQCWRYLGGTCNTVLKKRSTKCIKKQMQVLKHPNTTVEQFQKLNDSGEIAGD